jgi:DNA replication and repair protein RecF
MKFTNLNTINFRNYSKASIGFDDINIFIGNNAQGKTNILEALYLLSTSRSFRTNNNEYLIKSGEKSAKLTSKYIKKEIKHTNSVTINSKKKEYETDDKKISSAINFIGKINCSALCPEDINIIKEDSSQRRRYIDILLSQTNFDYLLNISKYNRILKHKNRLLKDIKIKKAQRKDINTWNEQQRMIGKKISEVRNSATERLNYISRGIYEHLSGGKETFSLGYFDSVSEERFDPERYENLFEGKQEKHLEEEIQKGFAVVGPHRDDILINVNHKAVKGFGSEGQQRSAAICLSLTEIEFINETLSEYPVLLVDDIYSELDDQRKASLMELLNKKTQLFLTGTRLSEFKGLENQAKVFRINEGRIEN